MTGTEEVERYLEVGRAVLLHTKRALGDEGRIRTFIRGWQRGAYVLLDIPAPADSGAPLRVHDPCTLRFLANGDACGCDSVVQDLGTGSHFSYVRVRWPQALSCVRVRKHERIHLHAPCAVSREDGKVIEGEIVDLSTGGCKVQLATILAKGQRLSLSFSLPDGSVIEGMNVNVCASGQDNDGAWVGCEYHDPEEAAIYDIEFFVATTLARLRVDRPSGSQVLIIERDAKQVNDLKLALRDAGYQVTLAPGAVDGFFWLRLSTPSVLLTSVDHDVISGVEICKIVKATRQFKHLPIIVYGGDPAAGKRALEAGADGHFASAKEVQQIAGAVKKAAEQTKKDGLAVGAEPPAPKADRA